LWLNIKAANFFLVFDLMEFIFTYFRTIKREQHHNMATLQLQKANIAQTWSIMADIFAMLEEFVQPLSTTQPSTIALKINSLYPSHRQTPSKRKQDEGPEEVWVEIEKESGGSFLWEFWELFFDTARQIYYDNPTQDRLVQLIIALRELDCKTTFKGRSFQGMRIWADLPQFDWVAVEFIETLDRYTADYNNFSIFGARLTREGVSDFSLWAIWELRLALEEEPDPRARNYKFYGSDLDLRVPLAAKWIAIAGESLYKSNKPFGGPAKGGRLWKGKEGFSIGRWLFWKRRFKEVQENAMARDETRRIVSETKKVMERLDGESGLEATC
jgi:hypothetical protein